MKNYKISRFFQKLSKTWKVSENSQIIQGNKYSFSGSQKSGVVREIPQHTRNHLSGNRRSVKTVGHQQAPVLSSFVCRRSRQREEFRWSRHKRRLHCVRKRRQFALHLLQGENFKFSRYLLQSATVFPFPRDFPSSFSTWSSTCNSRATAVTRSTTKSPRRTMNSCLPCAGRRILWTINRAQSSPATRAASSRY